ncbi:MAG: isopentenyl-diphosphate Delta-isomerase [Flavobacteriales bacterium]|nr:isopentenyl-diphosphate Delta-isomerase [Flavobacteriales bacterium]MDG1766368.1 isopentenyl-diphosphate Delta-isomerase [Flavobacteriales bacterium]
MEEVILVNEQDVAIGRMEKMEAHEKGLLHRAFSIFIFNSKGEMLLHQRAIEKYHSGGLWTNACCSHPRVNESLQDATNRRLQEEMGLSCLMDKVFQFIYKAELDHGLTEHELDHVFVGISDDEPIPNPEEVASFRYASLEAIDEELLAQPQIFTEWFKICYPRVAQLIREQW